jgi:hypothetical protein
MKPGFYAIRAAIGSLEPRDKRGCDGANSLAAGSARTAAVSAGDWVHECRGAPAGRSDQIAAFWRGVSESGYLEGRDVAIEYRWVDDKLERMPALADDLVRGRVSVIVTGSKPASGARSASGDEDHSDCIRRRRRPDPGWSRRQPKPAERQRNGCVLFHDIARGKAIGNPPWAGTGGESYRDTG